MPGCIVSKVAVQEFTHRRRAHPLQPLQSIVASPNKASRFSLCANPLFSNRGCCPRGTGAPSMVKRKRLPSSTKPTTLAPNSDRRNGRHHSAEHLDVVNANHRNPKRSRSTDSADSAAAPQVRGRSAPTLSYRDPPPSEPSIDTDMQMTDVPQQNAEPDSPASDKLADGQRDDHADEQQEPRSTSTTSNGHRSRPGKPSSVKSSNSQPENVPQISITESSTEAPSLVNGRVSESLSSLSEIDTVDSEAETERIEEFEEEQETAKLEIDEEEQDEVPMTSLNGTSDDENGDESPLQGRKRRRREIGLDEVESAEVKVDQVEDGDELATKRSRIGSNDEEEKPAAVEEIELPVGEAEEPEPEEGNRLWKCD
jgi:hypothetical protein